MDERGGERVWRLFPVYGALFSFTPNVKKSTAVVLFAPVLGDGGLNGVSALPVDAIEPPPLRRFIPHLCHAACRIVVMAEDTKVCSEREGGVGHCEDGGSVFGGR